MDILINKIDYLIKEKTTIQTFWHGMSHTSLFGINAIGVGRCQYDYRLQYPIENRALQFYCIILITRGKAFFCDEFQSYTECGVGDSFLLIPGQSHSYGIVPGHDFEETWIAFNGSAISQAILNKRLFANGTFFPSDKDSMVVDLFQKTLEVASSNVVQLQRQLPGLFLQIFSHYTSSNSSKNNPWIQDAIEYISSNALVKINLPELSTRYHMSYSSFRSLFKKEMGISPGLYHLKQKLNHACQLLTQGISVSEVSQLVGIDDVYYFSRVFKNHLGCPPSEYIKLSNQL